MKFDWIETLKKGFVAWLVVGAIQLGVFYALAVNVGLSDIVTTITANVPMGLFGMFITVLVAGFALGLAEKF